MSVIYEDEEVIINREVATGKISYNTFKDSHNITLHKKCIFDNVTFKGDIEIKFSGKFDLYFKGCLFKGCLYLSWADQQPIVSIQNSTLHKLEVSNTIKEVKLEDNPLIKIIENSSRIIITNSENSKSKIDLISTDNLLKAINLSTDRNALKINAVDSKGGPLVLNHCDVGRLTKYAGPLTLISCSINNKLNFLSYEASIEIKDSYINSIDFQKGSNVAGKIDGRTVNSILFDRYQPEATLEFENVTVNNNVTIIDSNLSPLRFFRCFFEDCRFKISKTNPKELEIDSVRWPEYAFVDIWSEDKEHSITAKDHLEISDFYRHLKLNAIEKEDKANQLKFYAFEMSSYYKSLSLKKNTLDKINLFISKITNYFGLNWGLPILWYIVITLLAYTAIYLGNVGIHPLNFFCMYADIDLAIMSNPAHSFKNYETIKYMSSGGILIDNILRIFQGLLVYQTISAFRKFFKT